MLMVLANTSYELEPKVKVKGQIMYFLVNASSPKVLDVHRSYDVESIAQHLM